MTYNSRRDLLGAITVPGKFAYHLFNIQYSSAKRNFDVTLLRRSKWGFDESSSNDNENPLNPYPSLQNLAMGISGLDFHPCGESAATLSHSGVCLLSQVDTNSRSYSLDLGKSGNFAWKNYL